MVCRILAFGWSVGHIRQNFQVFKAFCFQTLLIQDLSEDRVVLWISQWVQVPTYDGIGSRFRISVLGIEITYFLGHILHIFAGVPSTQIGRPKVSKARLRLVFVTKYLYNSATWTLWKYNGQPYRR